MVDTCQCHLSPRSLMVLPPPHPALQCPHVEARSPSPGHFMGTSHEDHIIYFPFFLGAINQEQNDIYTFMYKYIYIYYIYIYYIYICSPPPPEPTKTQFLTVFPIKISDFQPSGSRQPFLSQSKQKLHHRKFAAPIACQSLAPPHSVKH